MARRQQLRQGDLLALMEPGPTVPVAARKAVVPLLATLLLEVVETEFATSDKSLVEAGGRDEQDRV